ncbi:MAG: A/G-specific adenine glycosylase [Flavobacteriaceae bacterium]|nr:A/G-specific adenine glycosylase [Flavobacteriaceae bacterium]
MNFRKPLIYWYLQNKRALPWRLTEDPYKIWLSEIMLQQTTVAQGLPYFNRFINKMPTLEALANTDEEIVLKLWQGLGYYSRARNLLTTAKYVNAYLKGVFPTTYKDLLKLKGIGPYTAAAIASICYKEPIAVVDGNVYRVLSRYFNCDTPINSTLGVKYFNNLAQQMLDRTKPDIYNQAIMELGALICKPNKPNCSECPINNNCAALQHKTIVALPVKIKKKAVKKRYFNYLVILTDNDNTVLTKRTKKGIWLNLYEFPLAESNNSLEQTTLTTHPVFKALFDEKTALEISCFNQKEIVHKLTHQHIYTKFWILKTAQHPLAKINFSDIDKYPVPTLIHNFINAFTSH